MHLVPFYWVSFHSFWSFSLFISCLCHFLSFLSPQRVTFNISSRSGLVFTDSFRFFLYGPLFIFPSIFNDSLSGQSILGCKILPFSKLNISCHFFLACHVSGKRSAASFTGFLYKFGTSFVLPCLGYFLYHCILQIYVLVLSWFYWF